MREGGMTWDRRARRNGVIGPLYWKFTGCGSVSKVDVHGGPDREGAKCCSLKGPTECSKRQ